MLLHNDIGFLLGMAFANGAFFGYDTVADLLQQQLRPGEDYLALKWKKSALKRPILRKCTLAGGVTEAPMPRHAYEVIFKQTFKNAGYLYRISFHAIRRALGKVLDMDGMNIAVISHSTLACSPHHRRSLGQSTVTAFHAS